MLGVGSAIPRATVAIAVATAALVARLAIKARWEEHRLGVRYPRYSAYAARTPRFIPSPREALAEFRSSSSPTPSPGCDPRALEHRS